MKVVLFYDLFFNFEVPLHEPHRRMFCLPPSVYRGEERDSSGLVTDHERLFGVDWPPHYAKPASSVIEGAARLTLLSTSLSYFTIWSFAAFDRLALSDVSWAAAIGRETSVWIVMCIMFFYSVTLCSKCRPLCFRTLRACVQFLTLIWLSVLLSVWCWLMP